MQQKHLPPSQNSRAFRLYSRARSLRLVTGFVNGLEGNADVDWLQAQAPYDFERRALNCLQDFAKATVTSSSTGFSRNRLTFGHRTNSKLLLPNLSAKDWNSIGSVFVGAATSLSTQHPVIGPIVTFQGPAGAS